MRNDICYLGNKLTTENQYGDIGCVVEWSKAFCTVKSVGRSEFYQAKSAGVKPTLIITLREEDYEGQRLCRVKDVVYDVLKTYNDGTEVELTLTKEVHPNE